MLRVSLSETDPVDFFEDHLVYRGKIVKFADIDGVCYLWTQTTQRVNFVPINKVNRYSVAVRANGVSHDFLLPHDSFYKGGAERNQQNFAILSNILSNIISPFVVANLLLEYSDRSKLEIKDLTITPEGLYKGLNKKRLWGKPSFLPWSEYHNSVICKGGLYIYRKADNKPILFTRASKPPLFFSCSTYVYNAVLAPEILNFLFQKDGVVSGSVRSDLLARKKGLSQPPANTEPEPKKDNGKFCPNCGSQVLKVGQRFCSQCGKKLV